MRLRLVALAVLLAVPSVPAAGDTHVVLSELLPSPETGKPEFVELWNRGSTSVDLAGWKVGDVVSTPSNFTFGPRILAAGARVVVWSGSGAAETPEGPKWTGTSKWNDAGDTVRLFDASGRLVESLAYRASPGPGEHSAPAKAQSLALVDGVWQADDPTPGYASGAQAIPVDAEVAAVAPVVTLVGPSQARANRIVRLELNATDANGDLASWELSASGQRLAGGATSGARLVNVTAPNRAGPWTLSVTAVDATGLQTQANLTLAVVARDLEITLPDGPPSFGLLRPGERNVTAAHPLVLRNVGNETVTVRVDVSDLRNGTATIPVAGNLHLIVDGRLVAYSGSLASAGALAPGGEMRMLLRLAEVPTPAAPGRYGTSLAVVSA